MKIVHITSSDVGGAGKAAQRVVNSLKLIGVDVDLLVEESKTGEAITLHKNNLSKGVYSFLRKLNSLLLQFIKPISMFSIDLFGANILNKREVKEADILHFHWINAGVVPYRILKKIGKLKTPVIWTFHDMNPFTGGCHYDGGCGKFQSSCEKCPLLSNTNNKTARLIQQKKRKIISELNIIGVGCSSWISECAKSSTIFKGKDVVNIGNTLDFEKFRPVDREQAKKKLGINTEKKLILFGAVSSDKDERKGFKHLVKTINQLSENDYSLVVFGSEGDDLGFKPSLDVYKFGSIEDEEILVQIYNCADVFVAPSVQENLSNAVMESMACGTPVVVFDIGGMKDMVSHKTNGYLAKPFSNEDLAKGIKFCSSKKDIRINTRETISKKFPQVKIATQYNELYNRIIGSRVGNNA